MDLFIPMFLAAIVLMLKPGPHFLAMTSLAADGRWKSMSIFWASATLASTINYFLLLGILSSIPQGFGMLYIFIKSAAAIFFVSTGIMDLQKAGQINHKAAAKQKEKITKASFFNSLVTGSLTALSNPYVIVFVLTAIPAITGQTSFTFWEIAIVRSAVIAADIVVLAIFCVPLLVFHSKLQDTFLIKVKYIAALIMIGIGIYFFVSMITQWDLKLGGLLNG